MMNPFYFCSFMTLFYLTLVNSTRTSFLSSDCNDPLACYLSSLSFNIPDITVDIEGTTFSLTGTVCNGIDLYSLPSNYDGTSGFYLGISGLGTSCAGNYAYGKLMKGQITIAIANTDVAMTISDQKVNEFPVYVNLSSCAVTSIDITIHFSSAGLDFLAPLISSAIEKALYKVFCDGLNQLLSVRLTDFLVEKLDPKLEQIISSTSDPFPTYSNHYLNWNSSFISKIHGVVDKITGISNLPDFLQCMANTGKHAQAKKSTTVTSPFSLATEVSKYYEPTYQKYFQALFEKQTVDLSGWANTEVLAENEKFSLKIVQVDISGLETLTDLQIFEPIPESKVSLRTAAKLDFLNLDITFQLTVQGVDEQGNPHTYNEQSVVSLEITDPGFIFDLVIAVDEHLLDSYYLDQLSSIGCWLSPIAEISIPNLELDLSGATLTVTEITGDAGLLESDITTLLNNLFLLVLSPSGYGTLTVETIQGLFQGPIRQSLNTKIASSLSQGKAENPCLSHYPYDDVTEYVKWPNSQVISVLDSFINDLFGYEGLNSLFSCATDGTGAISIDTQRLVITLSGLTSFYGLQVFAPFSGDESKQYHLSTSLAAGYCPSTDNCNPLTIGINSISKEAIAEILGTSTSSSLTAAVSAAVDGVSLLLRFENFEIGLETLTQLNINALKQLQHAQMGVTGCYASSLDTLAFQDVNLTVSGANFIYKDGANNKNITLVINQLLAFLTKDETIDSKNSDLEDTLSSAPAVCAAGGVSPDAVDETTSSSEDSNGSLDWEWQLFILICGCLLSLSALLMAYNYWGREKKITCLALGAQKGEDHLTVLHDDGKTFWERWDFDNSLIFRSETPVWLKISMPIAICAAMAFFAWSNSDPVAVNVMVKIHIGEKVIDVGSIFQFGLSNTVHDMWVAGVYPLSVLVAFFSGAWPYIKLALMLYAWFAPVKLLAVEKRETLLIVLDALGKWSLVDFFVMVLMLCAFYIQLWVGTSMLVDVTVEPGLGFYTFLLATMMSLGLSHLILACHRLIVEPKVLPIPAELDPKESLASIIYEVKVPHSEEETVTLTSTENQEELTPLASARDEATTNSTAAKTLCIKFTYFGKVFVGVMIIVTALFIVLGSWYLTMGFEFKGLTGLMLGDQAKVDYSYITIGNAIPEHSGIPNNFGVRWMQASFFLFGLAMPLALMTVFMILWTVPLTLSRQRQLFVLSEVLNAWSTIDVFCCAIAAGLLEIQQFAMFIVGDSCDKINQVLETYLDEKLEGDDTCFDVIAYLRPESWLIFMAAALVLIVGIPFLRICNHAIKQRLETTTSTVMETVRRRSRSIGLFSGNVRDDVSAIIEEGVPVEKNLVEPLVLKNPDQADLAPDSNRDSNPSNGTGEQSISENTNLADNAGATSEAANKVAEKKSFWSKYFNFQHTQYSIIKGCAKLGLINIFFKEASRHSSNHAVPNTNIGGSSSGSFSGPFSPYSRNMLETGRQD